MLYTTDKSKVCKQCIDDNNVMCLNNDHDQGTCCTTKDACSEIDVCSYMVPQDSFGLKYWSCPNQLQVCGSAPYLIASKSVITQEITQLTQRDFLNGAMCHYRIVFPQGSSEFDQIIITLKKDSSIKAILTETETFRS